MAFNSALWIFKVWTCLITDPRKWSFFTLKWISKFLFPRFSILLSLSHPKRIKKRKNTNFVIYAIAFEFWVSQSTCCYMFSSFILQYPMQDPTNGVQTTFTALSLTPNREVNGRTGEDTWEAALPVPDSSVAKHRMSEMRYRNSILVFYSSLKLHVPILNNTMSQSKSLPHIKWMLHLVGTGWFYLVYQDSGRSHSRHRIDLYDQHLQISLPGR